jgi:hypothetical protein
MTRCPGCHTRIVRKSGDGKLRARTRVLAIGNNGVEIVCRKCGAGVPLQLQIGPDLKKALDEPIKRLVINPTEKLDSHEIIT